MIDSLAAAITVAALLGAIVVATTGGAGRYRWRTVRWWLAALQVAVTAQAVVAVVSLVAGHPAREPVVHLAYLGVSVALLPVLSTQVRRQDDRWSVVLVVVALMVLGVVVVRAQSTWRPGPATSEAVPETEAAGPSPVLASTGSRPRPATPGSRERR